MNEVLKAPFPWFGGKSRVSHIVWERFGNVRNYVEPFFGSGAVLLGRPQPFDGVETVNDKDGYVANFWRALQSDPEAVARHADWPVNENDLHARHWWLLQQKESLVSRLEGDAEWFDAKIAGWWVWGISCWIGSGFCSGAGPWQSVEMEDGTRKLVHLGAGRGVKRQLVHLGDAGRGVNRQLVHLGDAGQGVKRQLVHLGSTGQGVNITLADYLGALADRMKNVRVCCGDWSRVCTPAPTIHNGTTAVFLDPPYADTADRCKDLYATDDLSVAHEVREWAIAHGNDTRYRIALCGYEGEHDMPGSWSKVAWKSKGGYGSRNANNQNAHRERIWFSPHCLPVDSDTQPMLWEDEE